MPHKICPLTVLSVGTAEKGRNANAGIVRKAPQLVGLSY